MPKTANHNAIVGIRDRIDRKEITEIRDGAISSLYQKLKNHIFQPREITHTKNKNVVGSVLWWINERTQDKDSGSNPMFNSRLIDAIRTLTILATTDAKSQELVKKYGAKEFFIELKKDVGKDFHHDIDILLTALVNESHDDQENTDVNIMKNQHPMRSRSIYSPSDSMSMNEEPSYQSIPTEEEYRVMKEQTFVETINDRDLNTRFGMTYRDSHNDYPKQMDSKPRVNEYIQEESIRSNHSMSRFDLASIHEEQKVIKEETTEFKIPQKPIAKNMNRTFIKLERK